MRLFILSAGLCVAFGATKAETVIPVATIPARHVIQAQDLVLHPATVAGAISDPNQIIGMEARVALFTGRPIRPGDLVEPALVERNQTVTLVFVRSGLQISAEGRALGRAAAGDTLRVMNMSSRTTVFGTVQLDGSVQVSR